MALHASQPLPRTRRRCSTLTSTPSQSTLSPTEQRALGEIRTFLETEVRPRADEFWERAESPRHLIPRLAELDLYGNAFAETGAFENSCVYRGWLAMEISRVDPSTAPSSVCTPGWP